MDKVLVVARYQVKLLSRSWLVRFFVILVCVMFAGIQFWKYMSFSWWGLIALPSSIALTFLRIMDFMQSLFILFIAMTMVRRQEGINSLEAIYCRPTGNLGYIAGKSLGVLFVFLGLNVFVLFVAFLLQWLLGVASIKPEIYLFYFFTLTLPSLCFWIGITSLAGGLFGNRGIALFFLLVLWGMTFFCLMDVHHDLFDSAGWGIPVWFSDIVGLGGGKRYLHHRCIYLLLGVGCWLLSVVLFGRLPNRKNAAGRVAFVGILCVVSAVCLGWGYDRVFRDRDAYRETLREAYATCLGKTRGRILSHDITCHLEDGRLRMESLLIFQNRTGDTIQECMLFLNPALKITEITIEKESVSFRRDEQVVVLERSLPPGDSLAIAMNYEGKIDDAICYLDVTNVEYYRRTSGWNNIKYHYFSLRNGHLDGIWGEAYSFLSPAYVLLYPECIWYPVAVPPLNPAMPLDREMDFTRYTLRVLPEKELTVISQGKRARVGEMTEFRNDTGLSGISLCVGKYERLVVQVDSLDLELYYFPGHDFFKEGIFVSREDVVDQIRDMLYKFSNDYQSPLLFKSIRMVETPVNFLTHDRKWDKSNNMVQPGLLFVQEKGVMDHINAFLPSRETNENTGRFEVSGRLATVMHDIAPMYSTYAGYIYDRDYPCVERILREAFSSGVSYMYRNKYPSLGARDYLEKESLREVLVDRELAAEQVRGTVGWYGEYLKAYLLSKYEKDSLKQFMDDYMNRHQFQEVSFAKVNESFGKRFGIDLGKVMADLYDRKGRAWIKVKDAKIRLLEDSGFNDKELISFKVFNASDVESVIRVHENGNDLYYVIGARECKEIRYIVERMPLPEYLLVSTVLSCNIPESLMIDMKRESGSDDKGGVTGVFDCDSICFELLADEFIVDDSDLGFSVRGARNKWLRSIFRDQMIGGYQEYGDYISREWKTVARPECYGDPVCGAHCKTVGKGNDSAEWTICLPKEGKYEVFVYLPKLYSMANEECPDGMKTFYTVTDMSGETEVVVVVDRMQRGWVSLGQYNFMPGEAKVILQERVESDVSSRWGNYIIADAMKWKYISK